MKLSKIMLLVASALLITGNICAGEKGHHGKHWSYEGAEGPNKWGQICKEYSACMKREKQSPINITSAKDGMLDNITFNYKANKLDVIKDGHVTDVGITINPAELVPAKTMYSRYTGSLTTPPCSQGVKWFVMFFYSK